MSILRRETVTLTVEVELDEIGADLLRRRLQDGPLAAAFRLAIGWAVQAFLGRLGWASGYVHVAGGTVGQKEPAGLDTPPARPSD
jgi:hypothetical protein